MSAEVESIDAGVRRVTELAEKRRRFAGEIARLQTQKTAMDNQYRQARAALDERFQALIGKEPYE